MKPSAAAPSKSSSTVPEAGGPEPGRRGGWVILLLGLALTGWIGVRVKAAMTGREAVAREHATVAKVAAETASRPPTVKVVRATRASWQPQVTFEGTLAPAHEADVGFKSAGRIAAIHVKVGDRVRAGTVLANLDAREAQAQVAAAEAQQQAAEAQL